MDLKIKLREIVDNTDTFYGKIFNWIIIFLIVYSIITLTVETLPELNSQTKHFFRISEIVVTILFTVEYFLRAYVAKKISDYVFSFNGLIDLLAIIPFYLTLVLGLGGIDLRAVRAFRLLRIVRLLKIGRYNKAMQRFKRAYEIAREEMILYLFLTIILLYISATGIYYFENPAQPEAFKSILHSFWWAVVTLTTVGYGDVYPITFGGRIFTFFVLMIGLGIIAIPAGLVSSSLSKAREEEKNDV